jgi:hypothetical protein
MNTASKEQPSRMSAAIPVAIMILTTLGASGILLRTSAAPAAPPAQTASLPAR